MIQSQWFAPGSDLSSLLPLRRAVFDRDEDALDPLSWNVRVDQENAPAATGRIWWQDGAFRLGDICVLPAFRRQGLGDLTLRLLLFKAQSHAAREVRLQASPGTAAFFARLGFRPDPDMPESDEMLLPGDEINLDSCRSCPRQDCPRRAE